VSSEKCRLGIEPNQSDGGITVSLNHESFLVPSLAFLSFLRYPKHRLRILSGNRLFRCFPVFLFSFSILSLFCLFGLLDDIRR
jgi:hypothetical protein